MSWILILAIGGSVSFQTFDRKDSCESARVWIEQHRAKTDMRYFQTVCLPK